MSEVEEGKELCPVFPTPPGHDTLASQVAPPGARVGWHSRCASTRSDILDAVDAGLWKTRGKTKITLGLQVPRAMTCARGLGALGSLLVRGAASHLAYLTPFVSLQPSKARRQLVAPGALLHPHYHAAATRTSPHGGDLRHPASQANFLLFRALDVLVLRLKQ